MSQNRYKVELHIYDLSQGMAAQFSLAILGKKIDGIWHTGVHVYGLEYFYGGGIQAVPHHAVKNNYGMHPVQILHLGFTTKNQDELCNFLNKINHRFTATTYHLLENNCNNFSNEVVSFLLGTTIPQHILDLPNETLSSPIGAMLRPMIENMHKQMLENSTSIPTFGIPFNDPNKLVTNASSKSSDTTISTKTSIDDILPRNIQENNFTYEKILYSNEPFLYLDQICDKLLTYPEISNSDKVMLNTMHEKAITSMKQMDLTLENIKNVWELIYEIIISIKNDDLIQKDYGFGSLCMLRILLLSTDKFAMDNEKLSKILDKLLDIYNNNLYYEDATAMAFTILLHSCFTNLFIYPFGKSYLYKRYNDILLPVFKIIYRDVMNPNTLETTGSIILWNYLFCIDEFKNTLSEEIISSLLKELLVGVSQYFTNCSCTLGQVNNKMYIISFHLLKGMNNLIKICKNNVFKKIFQDSMIKNVLQVYEKSILLRTFDKEENKNNLAFILTDIINIL